jgi:hypothetical protein
MPFTEADRRRATREFFRSEIKNLESADRAVLRSTARALQREIKGQLRKFKKGANASGGFQKAVKVYEVKERGSLPLAEFVRLGVPFMDAFEEGKTITGDTTLIILLSTAPPGFRRISKGNPWARVWEKIRDKARIIPVADGSIVAVDVNGKLTPVYKFQRSVKLPKKLSFYEAADRLSAGMADEVQRLLEGGSG